MQEFKYIYPGFILGVNCHIPSVRFQRYRNCKACYIKFLLPTTYGEEC